jgi:glycosyltransferase involved in cell wall biosynthesis
LLAAEGIEITYSPFLSPRGLDAAYGRASFFRKGVHLVSGYSRRLREALEPGAYDVAYVFREAALLGGAWIERLLARRLPFVLDFDDAIFLTPPVSINRGAGLLKNPGKTDDICRLARHVVTGNQFLASYARRFTDAVTVIPSTIDTDAYRMAPRAENRRPIIGWTGSPTTVCYLETISNPLARLRRELDFELRVIGADLRMAGVDTTASAWSAATEVNDLRPLDAGLMPLEDDDWCRGKCGLKALQYMALGIPPVVSPVGFNKEIVEDGVNGFLASSDDEWVEKLLVLLRDPALRARLGSAARHTVEERFSAKVQAPRMADVLRKAAAR